MQAYKLYWLTRLPEFSDYLGIIMGACFLITMVSGAFWFVAFDFGDGQDKAKISKALKGSIFIGLICGFVSIFIPSRQDLLLILGGQAAFDIANNQQVSGIVKDGLSLIQDEINKARQDKKDSK